MMRVVHLSDLHFNRERLQNRADGKWRFILEWAANCCRADAVAVTGDLTSHGAQEEFEAAEGFLRTLSETAGIPLSRFFFCRGNHDADAPASGSTFHNYESFVGHFDREKRNMRVDTEDGVFSFYPMNTCRASSLVDYDNSVFVEEEVEQLAAEAGEQEYTIVLMHHQIEIIRNHNLAEQLANRKLLMLSGHLHPSEPRFYSFHGIPQINGMAVTPHLSQIPAGFQVIELKDRMVQRIIPIVLP